MTKVLELKKSEPTKTDANELAKIGLDPLALAAGLTVLFSKGSLGELPIAETYGAMLDHVKASGKGDHTEQRAMLIAQSHALNAVFVELARRSAINMGQSLEATERYMRLAFKAQAQSRATIETLDRLDNGHEQTVRHVRVDNRGGQAVIAENVNSGGQEIGKICKQSHATGAAGIRPALSCPDAVGNGMPIPCCEGKASLPDARRHKSRRTWGH